MRKSVVAIVAACLSVPGTAQITNSGDNPSLNQFFDRANQCLSDFDMKAKAKKLSVDSYKAAVDGACVDKIKTLRALYMLSMERNPNQDYHIERFDANVKDTKAKMVSDYAMR